MRRQFPVQPIRNSTRVAALVVLLAVLVATVAALLGYSYAKASFRAEGTVALNEIAGNRPAYELNTFAADLESALSGPAVREAVLGSVPDGSTVTPIEVSRLADASRVDLSVAAESAPLAEQALLAAGRTAYSQVVAQQRRLLQVRASAARSRLDDVTQEVERLRVAIEAAPEAEQPAQQFLLEQQQQAAGLAVADLASAQGGLAVAEQIDDTLETSDVVSVGEVYATSVLTQVLRVAAAGLLGGALMGGLLALAVWNWRRPSRVEPQHVPVSETAPATNGAGRPGSGMTGAEPGVGPDDAEDVLVRPGVRF